MRAGTHFGRLCWSVRRFGWVCPGFAGSRSRLPNMDSGKTAFMSGPPRAASSSLKEPSPQVLILLGGARFISWRLRCSFLGECQRGMKHFWRCWAFLGYSPALNPPREALCHTRPVGGKNDQPDLFPAVNPESFVRTVLSAVLNLLFCIYVLFIQYICSTYFLFFRVFFLAPNRPGGVHVV